MKYYRWLLIVWTLRVSLACDYYHRGAYGRLAVLYHQYHFPNLMDGWNLVRDWEDGLF